MSKVQDNYTWGMGRRKSAVARVRLTSGTGQMTVNGRKLEEYFTTETQRYPLNLAFKATDTLGKFDVHVACTGGGVKAQAEATMLGIARALTKLNPEFDGALKEASLLTRDARMKERKKYGLRGARRGVQFSKR